MIVKKDSLKNKIHYIEIRYINDNFESFFEIHSIIVKSIVKRKNYKNYNKISFMITILIL